MESNKPKDHDIDGWKEFIMDKILSRQVFTRDTSLDHAREQFFIDSIHLTLKLRSIEKWTNKKSPPQMSVENIKIPTSNKKRLSSPYDIAAYKAERDNERVENIQARVDAFDSTLDFELRKKIARLASRTAKIAFEDFSLTAELMADLKAWGELIATGKSKRMYGNKTLVGVEMGVFLSRNKRFPLRSELSGKFESIGISIPTNTMQDCLEYYEVTLLVRDNQPG